MSIAGPALGVGGLISTAVAVTCTLLAIDPEMAKRFEENTTAAPPVAEGLAWSQRTHAKDRDAATAEPPQPAQPARGSECTPLEILFDPSSTSLNTKASETLQPFTQWLNKHPDAEVVIEGHADAHGSEDSNMWVSRERARTVTSVLTKDGFAKKQIVVRAFGSYSPVGDDPDDHARQRSAIISVKHPDGCPPGLDPADGSAP